MLCHWDEIPEQRVEAGHLRAGLRDLGGAIGTVHIGARRWAIPPGAQSNPAHVHDAEEELCFVVAGDGLSWQDGTTYATRAGDALLHRPGGPAHCLVGGERGMTAIVFGERRPAEVGRLPRTGLARVGRLWTEIGAPVSSFAREAEAGPLPVDGDPAPRPPEILAVDDVRADERDRGEFGATIRNVGAAIGSRSTGMRLASIAPGRMNAPPHCHS